MKAFARFWVSQAVKLVAALVVFSSCNKDTEVDRSTDVKSTRLVTNDPYIAACEKVLGPGKKFSCLDGSLIPITVNGKEDNTAPATCDKPGISLSLTDDPPQAMCAPYARVGTFKSPTNPDVTWAFLCKHTTVASPNVDSFDDIAVLASDSKTGATCFYNVDGHHEGPIDPPDSPTSKTNWIKTKTMATFSCIACHDSDPWIHTPYIDQVTNKDGTPIIPHSDLKTPYWLPGLELLGWERPLSLKAKGAELCTSCHRIGNLETCETFAPHSRNRKSTNKILHWKLPPVGNWMPPNTSDPNAEAAFKVVENCCDNPQDPSCKWESHTK